MNTELEELKQLAGQLKFKIKRSLHQDYFFDADKYSAELDEVDEKIKKLERDEKRV